MVMVLNIWESGQEQSTSTCHGLQCGRRISTFLLLVTLVPHLALLAAFSPAGLNITLTLFTNQSAEP